MMKALKALLIVVSVTFLASQPMAAHAHSALESSIPARGEMIEVLPKVISLTFNEDLISIEGEEVNTLALQGTNGMRNELLSPVISGAVLSAQVADGQYPAGNYVLTYRAVSADGHPITGELTFTSTTTTTIESLPATPVTTSASVEPDNSSSAYPIIGLAILFATLIGIWRKRGSWLK